MGQSTDIRVVENTNNAGESENSNIIYINKDEYDANTDGKLTIMLDLESGKFAVRDGGYVVINGARHEITIRQEDLDNGYKDVSYRTDMPSQDGTIDVTAKIFSSLSGVGTVIVEKSIVVDTTAPTLEIDDKIAGDNKITASEDNDVAISGKTDAEDGQTVTVTITDKNGDSVTATAVVDNGTWSVDGISVESLKTGELDVKAEVSDKAGNSTEKSTDSTITYVTLDSSDDSVAVSEDVPYTLTKDDFGDWQQQGSEPTGVVITELPTDGTLTLDGVEVTKGQTISMDDIDAGKLTFTTSENSDKNGSFEFKLTDGTEVSETAYTTTVTVGAVADAPTVNVETITHDSVKTGEGLTLTTYNNVLFQDLHPDDYVRNSNILESFADHYAEAYNGNTQTVSEIAPNNSLASETMVGAKGYVYLEAGQQVTFSGTIDDSAMIKLGGEVVLYTTGDAYGSVNTQSAGTSSVGGGEAVSTGAFTVSQSGYYSLETYVLNSGGPGNYNIQMSVDGGTTYQDINTKNFDIYATQADVTKYARNAGEENTDIKLSDIDAKLVDTDGSETLSISVDGLPEGATLSDGVNTFTASSSSTTADVTGWNLDNLTLNSPVAGTYNLNVVGTAKETSNGETATTSQILTVSVTNFPADDNAQFIPEKSGVLRDLQENVTTGDANDFLVVGDDIGSSHTYASKHVEVDMKAGNDVIEIDGAIDWYAKVNMGDGDDVIRSWAGSIKGDSVVDMGDGNDTITTDGGYYDRAEVYMGNGDDTLYARCNIDYDAKVDMGDGNDTVTLGGGMYANASLTLGDGNDTVTTDASINHQANIDAGNGDDTLNVTDGSIRHNATVDMGDGNDTINVHYHVGNNADIDLGDGNDTMSVEGSLWDKADIDMGSGDDSFTLKGNANGESTVDLGAGEDTLTLSNPGHNIDLTNVSKHFDNVETLDISSNDSTKVTLSVADIIDSTDNDNVLKIDGDSNDSVVGDKPWSWDSWSHEQQDSWSFSGTENGYNVYVGTDTSGRTATLMVEDTIVTDL